MSIHWDLGFRGLGADLGWQRGFAGNKHAVALQAWSGNEPHKKRMTSGTKHPNEPAGLRPLNPKPCNLNPNSYLGFVEPIAFHPVPTTPPPSPTKQG